MGNHRTVPAPMTQSDRILGKTERWQSTTKHNTARARHSSHERFFHRNSNLIETSFFSHPSYNKVSPWNFDHDTTAALSGPVPKFCCEVIAYNGVTSKSFFHRIWITMENRSWNWTLVQISDDVIYNKEFVYLFSPHTESNAVATTWLF